VDRGPSRLLEIRDRFEDSGVHPCDDRDLEPRRGPRDDVMDVEGAVDAHSDQPAPAALTSLAGRGTGPGPRSRHCSQGRMPRRRHVRRRSAPPPEGSGPSCSPMGGPREVLKRVGRRAGEMPRMDRRLRERSSLMSAAAQRLT